MAKIRPITVLRDTNKLSEELHQNDEPIFITKNGYEDMVIMSNKTYENISSNKNEVKNNYSLKIDFHEKELVDSSFGFIRVATITPKTSISDVNFNIKEMLIHLEEVYKNDAKVIVFPELSISSYTCGDLFFQESLLSKVLDGIKTFLNKTKDKDCLIFVGAPLMKDGTLYNTALAVHKGKILGVIPKTFIPNYKEFYEMRYFKSAPNDMSYISLFGKDIPFGTRMLFKCESFASLCVGVDICEDLWVPNPPSTKHALNGATLIVNLSASNEYVGKADYRKELVVSTSGRLMCAYAYCSAGCEESSTDLVYSGDRIIASNSHLIGRGNLFSDGITYGDVDITRIVQDRIKNTSFVNQNDNYTYIGFDINRPVLSLIEKPIQNPFLGEDFESSKKRYLDIIKMQAYGLKKRLTAINCHKVVVGLSGGLDSTLALLVCKETFSLMKEDPKNIVAITMPCFGTSKRTYTNALALSKEIGCDLVEINIKESVLQHFKDIGQDQNKADITFENSQARERTQVLMDYANKINGFVVGTGDLSELALGWCTYNGDHMSMYAVNASIPKTLVKELVKAYAFSYSDALKETLLDIINTPISPELLPLDESGNIKQQTESQIGPYELVDFFLYYFVRHSFSLKKILYLAKEAYIGKYDEETLKHWLKTFVRRFYNSQFKRSCIPDGVKVGSVSLSPRGDYRMPSDASYKSVIEDLD